MDPGARAAEDDSRGVADLGGRAATPRPPPEAAPDFAGATELWGPEANGVFGNPA